MVIPNDACVCKYSLAFCCVCNSYNSRNDENEASVQVDDDLQIDGDGIKSYYHKNCESPGYVIFTVSSYIG